MSIRVWNGAPGKLQWPIVGLLAVALVVFVSACSVAPDDATEPSEEPTPLDKRLEPQVLGDIEDSLDCKEVHHMHDDVYFHDSMKGLYCIPQTKGGYPTEMRIYTEAESPAQTLDEQQGTIGENVKLLLGTNWYAVGWPEHLESIADTIGVEPVLWSSVPEPVPESHEDGMVDSCSTGAVTLIRNQVLGDSDEEAHEIAENSEEYFPGINKLSGKIGKDIISDHSAIDDSEFEFVITEYGARIKKFCRTAWQ